jgi:hypothetical protein
VSLGGWAVEAETRCADQPVVVDLCGQPVTVLPMWRWPTWALRALLDGDDYLWAGHCLTEAGAAVWWQTDPASSDVDEFLDDWETATGQDLSTAARMVGIVDEFGDPLEADLAFRGVDLRGLWRSGGLTWRRLSVLYDALPGESATKTAQANALGEARLADLAKRQAPDGFGPWSKTDLLIADLIDAVNGNTYVLQLANTDAKKHGKVPKPEPVHRPGLIRKRRRPTLSDEQRGLLAYMAANRGATPPGWKNVDTPGG